MVEDGILQGFTCRETPNFRKNHYFLEIENTSCVVHFKSNPWITPRNVGNSKLPRLSQFRKQRAVAQQLSLYPQDQYDMAESKCYFIFMYRNMGTSGSYIPAMCIGMPNQEYDGWIDIKDITNYPTVLSTDNTQQDYLKELKDQISLKISNIANEKYNS